MKMIDMTCPKCSAVLKVDDKKEKAVCEYCGYQVLLEREDTPEEIKAKAHAKSYGYHKGRLDAEAKAQEEAEKKKKNRKIKAILIVVAMIYFFGFWSLWQTYISTPKVNPFDYLEVVFTGTDGDGEVVVTVKPGAEGIDTGKIRFVFSKERDLLQGETVTVTASSDVYLVMEDTKTYTVEGLDEYLQNLEDIPAEALELIHLQAESAQSMNLDNSQESGHFLDMKPVKLYLLTDGRLTNHLYDVFEVHFSTDKGEKTFYVVSVFDNIVVRDGEQTSLNMSGGTYMGQLTQVQGWLHIMAYESLDQIRATLLTGQKIPMELKELDLR